METDDHSDCHHPEWCVYKEDCSHTCMRCGMHVSCYLNTDTCVREPIVNKELLPNLHPDCESMFRCQQEVFERATGFRFLMAS